MSNATSEAPTPAMFATWANKAGLMDSQARTLRLSIVGQMGTDETIAQLAGEAMAACVALNLALCERLPKTNATPGGRWKGRS